MYLGTPHDVWSGSEDHGEGHPTHTLLIDTRHLKRSKFLRLRRIDLMVPTPPHDACPRSPMGEFRRMFCMHIKSGVSELTSMGDYPSDAGELCSSVRRDEHGR